MILCQGCSRESSTHTAHIVNGEDAGQCEIPWQVKLQSPPCGGTLIAPRWVLTASHCYGNERKYGGKVWMGSNHVEQKGQYYQEFKIKRFIQHPDYDRSSKSHDIALVELDGEAKLNKCVNLAKLPERSLEAGNTCQISGFGGTREGEFRSKTLKKADVTILSNGECKNTGYSS